MQLESQSVRLHGCLERKPAAAVTVSSAGRPRPARCLNAVQHAVQAALEPPFQALHHLTPPTRPHHGFLRVYKTSMI